MEAIRKAFRPTTKTLVRAFLGLADYYRCFIPNFSSIASPLTDQEEAARDTDLHAGSGDCFQIPETSINVVTDFTCTRFRLSLHTPDRCFRHRVRGSLVPGTPCDLHQPAESKYAAVEKEARAIKWAVLELRYYFLGHSFTLITDHAPLQWMARAKDTNMRVTRWFLALQDFHFKVQHRAEASNVNADGLSRLRSG